MISPFFLSSVSVPDFFLNKVLKNISFYDSPNEFFLWYDILLANFFNGASLANGIIELRGKVDLLMGESLEPEFICPKEFYSVIVFLFV